MSELLTTGAIAREIGEPRSKVEYAIEKAGIQARMRAGILRLFSRDQVPVIQAALKTIRPRRVLTGNSNRGGSR